MSDILSRRPAGNSSARMDVEAVRAAYRRWAGVYDTVFGGILLAARRRAVALVNQLPGHEVLEVGVGTGLALPHYSPDRRITGIDLSAEMLAVAGRRVADTRLRNVAALHEMDAEATDFPDASFDTAVAMFVASVVPNPKLLLAEMRRVVRPGGNILFVTHLAADKGPRWWIERTLAPASRALGWHPDFSLEAMCSAEEITSCSCTPAPPFGFFTLVRVGN
ncbi:MAG TPA: class I SAM-dependent methyltransferase [Acetobacteraceae bacterium]|jgi:phosphatidylethanolamine/phosphatidyl-N-methylethanolamine N-methyltransferase|nr:class I SAM-dependent methyltransferase [Acetobacteraceae bacterium]